MHSRNYLIFLIYKRYYNLLLDSKVINLYVLPYGQMSLWGATVITNLMSAIPWIGQDIVEFIWGGLN